MINVVLVVKLEVRLGKETEVESLHRKGLIGSRGTFNNRFGLQSAHVNRLLVFLTTS